ncbi:MAG: acyl carrier protein [Pseudoalteromonas tetraodonis]
MRPPMSVPASLLEKSPEDVREELAGFPDSTIDAVLSFREEGNVDSLTKVVLLVIEYYLPRDKQQSLGGLPESTRLFDELGADSLLLAEVAFKLEELFGMPIDLQSGTPPETLGDLLGFLREKLG